MPAPETTLAADAPLHVAPRYRADIDGLRAVAVLLVVFNHLQFRHAEGGFVGVDVFFVISGYLIGASLIAEFSRNRFSLAAFYERRVRRIFPALLVMMAVVTAFAWHLLLPAPLVAYAQSALAALASVSNFLFWHQAGYFDAASAAKPLLHTWSLAVEEQFYLVFPLFLFAIFRWKPKALRTALWGVAAITLALSVYFVRRDAGTAFFWSPLRAWELVLGVLASQYRPRAMHQRLLRELAAAAGLLMILVPGVLYTAATPFPGLAALLPCLGTAMVIGAGKAGASGTAKLLSLPPMRFVGLISYSLYLWHWPVFVFQNTTLLLTPHPIWQRHTKLLVLAVSLLLATLSWWLVETPFRKGRLKPGRRTLFAVNGLGVAGLACVAAAMVQASGAPRRLPPEVIRVGSFLSTDTDTAWRAGRCFLLPKNSFGDFSPAECLNVVRGRPNVLLLGDSTAAHLYPGLLQAFPGVQIEQATAASCLPDGAPSAEDPVYRPNCEALWRFLDESWLPTHHVDAVVLAGHWDQDSPARLPAQLRRFRQLGLPVILVGPPLEFDVPVPTLIVAEMRHREAPAARIAHLSAHRSADEPLADSLEALAAREHARFIAYRRLLCDAGTAAATEGWHTADGCPLFAAGGDPLLFDQHHLTVAGSVEFAQRLRDTAGGLRP